LSFNKKIAFADNKRPRDSLYELITYNNSTEVGMTEINYAKKYCGIEVSSLITATFGLGSIWITCSIILAG
jgi:hypothetical protein